MCYVPNAKIIQNPTTKFHPLHPLLVCGYDLWLMIAQQSIFLANNLGPAMPSEIQGKIANSLISASCLVTLGVTWPIDDPNLRTYATTKTFCCPDPICVYQSIPRCGSDSSSGNGSVGFKSQPLFTKGELEHWPAFDPWKIVPTERRLEALHCHHARPWFKTCCKVNNLLETTWM